MKQTTAANDDCSSDLFSLLEAEARAVASAFGVVTANELAAALVDRIHHRIGGSKVHIAKRSRARRQEAYEALRRDFNGVNLRDVAARYGFSTRHARRILERK